MSAHDGAVYDIKGVHIGTGAADTFSGGRVAFRPVRTGQGVPAWVWVLAVAASWWLVRGK